MLEEEDILDPTAELGELEPVEEPLVPADVEMVEVVVETAAAPPPPSASDEAASALERAIAALRAGQLPTSSSEFTTTSTPVFQTQPLPEPVTSPEPPAAVAEPEPELAPEPEIVLTEFEAEFDHRRAGGRRGRGKRAGTGSRLGGRRAVFCRGRRARSRV